MPTLIKPNNILNPHPFPFPSPFPPASASKNLQQFNLDSLQATLEPSAEQDELADAGNAQVSIWQQQLWGRLGKAGFSEKTS